MYTTAVAVQEEVRLAELNKRKFRKWLNVENSYPKYPDFQNIQPKFLVKSPKYGKSFRKFIFQERAVLLKFKAFFRAHAIIISLKENRITHNDKKVVTQKTILHLDFSWAL